MIQLASISSLLSWSVASASVPRSTPRLNEQIGLSYDLADNLNVRTNGALVQAFLTDPINQLTNVSRAGTLTISGALPAPATETGQSMVLEYFPPAQANFALAFEAWRGNLLVAGRRFDCPRNSRVIA